MTAPTKTAETLEDRVRRYHAEEKPGDGKGGDLRIELTQVVRPGVVAGRDNLGEIDIFVDTSLLAPNPEPRQPYTDFAATVKKAWSDYDDMRQKYGMICVVEDRWHPFFARQTASFRAAEVAADALFIPASVTP